MARTYRNGAVPNPASLRERILVALGNGEMTAPAVADAVGSRDRATVASAINKLWLTGRVDRCGTVKIGWRTVTLWRRVRLDSAEIAA